MRAAPLIGSLLAAAAAPCLAREVGFSEARAAAQRAAPEVLLAERRSAVAATEVAVAGALTNPTLAVSTARYSARLGASLSVPLPVFGQRATAADAARADAEAVALDEGVVRREARWAATLAWIQLWEAQERARLLDLAAQDADRLATVATERFDAGTAPQLDVLRTRADRTRARAEARAAHLATGAAAARLAPLIGAPPAEELVAAGQPADPGAPPPSGALEVAAHPALRRDLAQERAAGAHLRDEQRQRWPQLSPQVTVNALDPSYPGADVIVGLALDLPVLNLRGGAIARAAASQRLAEATTSADQRALEAAVLDARRRTEAARSTLLALRTEVLPAMEEVKAMTDEGYQSGRLDLVRVIEAQRALLDSRLAEAAARAAWVRAAADLERAAGVDLEGGAP